MSKTIKKIAPIASIALPIALPGIGTAIGGALGASGLGASILGNAALGAGLGAVSGGGVKGAGLGAVTGGLAGGGGTALAQGAGLSGVAAKTAGGALTGAVGGGAAGGLKGAALGAGLGGGVGYLGAGGQVPGLGSMQEQLPDYVQGAPKPGTGALGALTQSTGSQPVKLGSLLNVGSDVLGYYQGQQDLEDIQDMYGQATQQAQGYLNPYTKAGAQAVQNLQAPDMEALMSDPGYQFQLQQGQQALDRSLASRGLGQSGAALKAAQQYGQGLANQTYNDYFNRQSQIANQGLGAGLGIGSIIGQGAGANAAAQVAMINNRNRLLSNLFGTNDENILTGSLGRILGGY